MTVSNQLHLTQQLLNPRMTRALGVYYITNAFTTIRTELWLVNALTWAASHVTDEAWPAFVTRFTDAAEKQNPWGAPRWDSRLVGVQKSVLLLLLPVVTEDWVKKAIFFLDQSDAPWEAFCSDAQAAGNPGPEYTFTAETAAAVAASCVHPPILSPYAPTVAAYRAIWNGASDVTSVADWAALALKTAGVENYDAAIIDAILSVFEAQLLCAL